MEIAGYRGGETLGKGAAGYVVRGQREGQPDVASKILRGGQDPRRALRRFRRESELLELLDGDGFVSLLDAGDSPYGPYLIMPLLVGGSLTDRLREGPLPLADAVRVGRRLGQAVGRAHRLGIVHRDLKPDNVLFDGAGRPLIADLGLAKRFGGDPRQSLVNDSVSRTGEVRGTAGYLAPEQITDSKSVGPAADVFALGAILYECVSGEPAFLGDSVMDVLSSLSKGQHRPLGELQEELAPGRPVPPHVLELVNQALDPNPSRRPPDGTAFAAALGAVSGASSGGERRAPAPEPPLLAGPLGIGLAFGLGLGLALLLWRILFS